MSLKNRVIFCSILIVLAACKASDINQEGRDIELQGQARPASASPNDAAKVTGLVRQTSPSYVTLSITQDDFTPSTRQADRSSRSLTSGSGYVVENTGFIMTAAHVAVAKGNSVSARAADGKLYSGTVIDISPSNDMALIKLKGFSGHAVRPAPGACTPVNAEVFSLGKPYSQGDVARVGSLQSMHFGKPVTYGKFGYPDAMVLHMNTQRGESGGPLFNSNGELIGMVVSTLADGNGRSLNMAHAIPATAIAGFLCRNISCQPAWQALSVQNTEGCGI